VLFSGENRHDPPGARSVHKRGIYVTLGTIIARAPGRKRAGESAAEASSPHAIAISEDRPPSRRFG
jgi:hypothetical protein